MADASLFERFFLNQVTRFEQFSSGSWSRFLQCKESHKNSIIFKLLERKKAIGIGLGILLVGYYLKQRNAPRKEKGSSTDPNKKRKPISKQFLHQLIKLLGIMIPSWRSKEMVILLLHTAFLISRTFLSIYVANLDGQMVKSLVDRDGKKFIYLLFLWLAVAIPATTVNSMIRYMESKLSLAFRTRLTTFTYKMYMTNETYYRVSNLDSRLSNPDQCLTEDISRFSQALAHLHSQLSKPILDVVLITAELLRVASDKGEGSGIASGSLAFSVVYITGKILQYMQPPFGKLAAQQAHLEGDLRFVHSRLLTNAEEISFYRGHKIEEMILNSRYLSLVKHMNHIFKIRIPYNILEGFFMKYVWSASGISMIAIPAFFFDPTRTNKTSEVISSRTQDYVTSKMLLVSAADAIERIMLTIKEINELAGFTERVNEMVEVFEDAQKGRYYKQMVRSQITNGEGSQSNGHHQNRLELLTQRGIVVESDIVKFDGVPIVSPNGDVLIASMNFEVKQGMHLLITGPNGCGKSSLFRILGGLWPVMGGTLFKPSWKDMFYIPQRPYLSLGTLRDQVIYPDTVDDMKQKNFTDKDLEEIFSWVNLLHILEREGGWNSTQEWKDVLSGGKNKELEWREYFTINQNTLFWTNALVQLAWTSKERCTNMLLILELHS